MLRGGREDYEKTPIKKKVPTPQGVSAMTTFVCIILEYVVQNAEMLLLRITHKHSIFNRDF